jgi:LEA14-like dessication related protein
MSDGHRAAFRLAALALAAVMLGGCALMHRNLEPPQVTLKGLTPESMTAAGQVFRTRLLLDNPNAEDLRVVGGQVNLAIGGVSAGQAETIGKFTLPANGSREVDLLVSLDLLSALPTLLRQFALGPAELDYQLRGYVDLDVKAIGRLPLKSSGKVSMDDLLRQAPGLMRRAPPRAGGPL